MCDAIRSTSSSSGPAAVVALGPPLLLDVADAAQLGGDRPIVLVGSGAEAVAAAARRGGARGRGRAARPAARRTASRAHGIRPAARHQAAATALLARPGRQAQPSGGASETLMEQAPLPSADASRPPVAGWGRAGARDRRPASAAVRAGLGRGRRRPPPRAPSVAGVRRGGERSGGARRLRAGAGRRR